MICIRYVMIGAILVGLTACSSFNTRWEHAEIPSDEWGVDYAQCRYEARRKAEKETDISVAEINLYGDEEDTINAMMTIANIKKRTRELFGRCMQEFGYTPVKR